MEFEKWYDSLLGCPSQCYYYYAKHGRLYTFYLRWRHKDPWQFYVIKGDIDDPNARFISRDLFRVFNLFLKEEDLASAKDSAVAIGKSYVEALHYADCYICGKKGYRRELVYRFDTAPEGGWLCKEHWLEYLENEIISLESWMHLPGIQRYIVKLVERW